MMPHGSKDSTTLPRNRVEAHHLSWSPGQSQRRTEHAGQNGLFTHSCSWASWDSAKLVVPRSDTILWEHSGAIIGSYWILPRSTGLWPSWTAAWISGARRAVITHRGLRQGPSHQVAILWQAHKYLQLYKAGVSSQREGCDKSSPMSSKSESFGKLEVRTASRLRRSQSTEGWACSGTAKLLPASACRIDGVRSHRV